MISVKDFPVPTDGSTTPSGTALEAEGHLTEHNALSRGSPHAVADEQKNRALSTHFGPTQYNSEGPF